MCLCTNRWASIQCSLCDLSLQRCCRDAIKWSSNLRIPQWFHFFDREFPSCSILWKSVYVDADIRYTWILYGADNSVCVFYFKVQPQFILWSSNWGGRSNSKSQEYSVHIISSAVKTIISELSSILRLNVKFKDTLETT